MGSGQGGALDRQTLEPLLLGQLKGLLAGQGWPDAGRHGGGGGAGLGEGPAALLLEQTAKAEGSRYSGLAQGGGAAKHRSVPLGDAAHCRLRSTGQVWLAGRWQGRGTGQVTTEGPEGSDAGEGQVSEALPCRQSVAGS